jgi:hypothetical protein
MPNQSGRARRIRSVAAGSASALGAIRRSGGASIGGSLDTGGTILALVATTPVNTRARMRAGSPHPAGQTLKRNAPRDDGSRRVCRKPAVDVHFDGWPVTVAIGC